MLAILQMLGMLVDVFKSRMRLEAENLFLRHQLNIALRRVPPRLRLRGSDRALCMGDPALAKPARGHAGGSTGDDSEVAPHGLQGVLALEIAEQRYARTW